MRDARGFTVVEALVGLGILIVAILGAMSFFIFGSSRAQESFRYKSVEEVLASVTALMSYDIQRAGFGLFPGSGTSYPQLGLFVVDGGGTTNPLPDELYVNYSQYLSLEWSPDSAEAEKAAPLCAAQYRAINSVFTRPEQSFICAPYTFYYQGFVTLSATVSPFPLYAVPQALSTADIGAVLATPTGVVGGAAAVSSATCTVAGSPAPQLPGTQNWQVQFSPVGKNSAGGPQAILAGWTAVPAISYRVVPGVGTGTGRLMRNNRPIMGGDAYVDVSNFQVTCRMATGNWRTTNLDPPTLRMVEINIRYRLNKGKGDVTKWSPVYSRTIRVTPRTIVLKQTVG
jgi:type II secretory pathway component PulJ